MKRLPPPVPANAVVVEGGYAFFTPRTDYRVHVVKNGQPYAVIDKGANAVESLLRELAEARRTIAAFEALRDEEAAE